MKGRLFLIHWDEAEAAELAGELLDDGWEVTTEYADGEKAAREILEHPPDAVVVSLRRLPSHGRETAAWLRSRDVGADVPIVFADGDPEKVEGVRDAVPDAIYTTWDDLSNVLAERLAT